MQLNKLNISIDIIDIPEKMFWLVKYRVKREMIKTILPKINAIAKGRQ